MDWLAVVRGSGIRPRKALGQSFLVDEGTLGRLVESWGVHGDEEVLEIGTGPGNLTATLAARARRVWTIEIDARLASLARRVVAAPNVVWIEGDALRLVRAVAFGQPMRVAGNLPYSSYREILLALLEWPTEVSEIDLTLQVDVVRKLVEPGPLAALLGSRFEVRKGERVPRNRFYPQPRVDSASVRLVPRVAWSPIEARRLERGLKRLFASKRKTLRSLDPEAEAIRISDAPIDALLRSADRITRARGGSGAP
jgi:16S rRNA (adenine1518-N6/adenine1519-N6)-dimethyltransferase